MQSKKTIFHMLIATLLVVLFSSPLHAEAPDGIGGTPDVPPGQAKVYDGLINEWETEPFDGDLIGYDSGQDDDAFKPQWAVVRRKITEPGVPYEFVLVHIGPEGKIQREVILGRGRGISISKDGHHFAINRYEYPGGFRPGGGQILRTIIVDNAGHTKRKLEDGAWVIYMGPGNNPTLVLGGRKGLLEAYDSRFRLLGAYGEPVPDGGEFSHNRVSVESGGYHAINLTTVRGGSTLFVLDRNGNLLFERQNTNPGRYSAPSIGISPEHMIVVLSGTKLSEEGGLRRYLSILDFSGREMVPEIFPFAPGAFKASFQFSKNGKYIRAWDYYRVILLDNSGVQKHQILTGGLQEPSDGYLSDEGIFTGFLPNRKKLVIVKLGGDIEETNVTKPSGIIQFNALKGKLLSNEKSLIGQCKLVYYNISDQILSEIRRKGGVR